MYIVMMSIMIIFERDKPKNIILWSFTFLATSIIGYIFYAVAKGFYYKKRESLFIKEKEDEIYLNLISNNLEDLKQDTFDELFAFNNLAYNTYLTTNNSFEMITDFNKLLENLSKDLKTATSYVFLEVTSLNLKSIDVIKPILFTLVEKGVKVKLSHEKSLPLGLKKELKDNGVSVYRFSKYRTIDDIYSNLRNVISIDGKVAYIANLNIRTARLDEKIEDASVFYKLKGDVVQTIDVNLRQDIIFASNKFIPYEINKKPYNFQSTKIQYIANQTSADIELALIKAICTAKTSIQLILESFIPTESITSLLKFAINSNIDVRLMVPLKTRKFSKYYAYRAYAKELALYGANVYLYDGFINSNQIVIDSKYAICGAFILDREHINLSLQNMLIIEDEKVISQFNKFFDSCINNSYRINDAKYMLLREKFFKNFV